MENTVKKDDRTQLEIAKSYLSAKPPEGDEYELAKKFCEKYKTINGTLLLQSPTPTGMLFYDNESKVIAGSENWEDKITTEDLTDNVYVIKTMMIGKFSEKELPEDVSDEVVMEYVYKRLEELEKNNPMDVYIMYTIWKTDVVRYKSDIGAFTSEEDVKKFEDEYPYEEIEPESRIFIRFARRRIWE